MAYIWSNWKYCKNCGHTNAYFYAVNHKRYKNGTLLYPYCKECWLEKSKKQHEKYNTEEYRESRRQYMRDNPLDLKKAAEANRRYRSRLRAKRLLERNRELVFLKGSELK